jgi:hypothetical protein
LKICFIVPVQKPQKCGITDYVNLLSQKFEFENIEVIKFEIKDLNEIGNLEKKLPKANIFSLQFAPYAFSKNGILGKSIKILANSLSNKKVHINFHEIWIGDYKQSSIKEKLIGWKQKKEILELLRISEPFVVTTSNSAYLYRLRKIGISPSLLYLFGNIFFKKKYVTNKNDFLNIIFFGTIYHNFPFKILIDHLIILSTKLKKDIKIKIIGRIRNSKGKSELLRICKPKKIKIIFIGESTPEFISKELQSSEIGVSTTPYDILGKSGTTSSMLEHGLPVIAYDDFDTPSEHVDIPKQFENQVFLISNTFDYKRIINFLNNNRNDKFDGLNHTFNQIKKIYS